jgi:20S proteasome subunit alpha 6
MNRNNYDGDAVTWSPQGRLYQVEYAMEAVKQGSVVVGVKSAEYAVLGVIKRNTSKLSSYQKKLFEVDSHIGIGIAGLTADARVLCKYMRSECLSHKFVYDSPLAVGRLVRGVADKSQVHTQRYGRRPYGVGLLVIGYDKENGPQLYETCPSGNSYHFKAQAIGARSQSARTYLERTYEGYMQCSLDELIRHVLLALRESAPKATDDKSTVHADNVAVCVVGVDRDFEIIDGDRIVPYLDLLDDSDDDDDQDDDQQGDDQNSADDDDDEDDDNDADVMVDDLQ